jgi:hypothetical protein
MNSETIWGVRQQRKGTLGNPVIPSEESRDLLFA